MSYWVRLKSRINRTKRKRNHMATAIEIIQKELPKYQGLTKMEKSYGLSHLNEWIPENGHLDILIKKFAEKSLDIRPFLNQVGLLKQ
jgi:hypothetical protein